MDRIAGDDTLATSPRLTALVIAETASQAADAAYRDAEERYDFIPDQLRQALVQRRGKAQADLIRAERALTPAERAFRKVHRAARHLAALRATLAAPSRNRPWPEVALGLLRSPAARLFTAEAALRDALDEFGATAGGREDLAATLVVYGATAEECAALRTLREPPMISARCAALAVLFSAPAWGAAYWVLG